MKIFKLLIVILAVIFSATTYSQNKTKKEEIKLLVIVKDAKNNAVPGAVILIDNVKQKRVANSAGYFKIKLKKAPKEIAAFSPIIGIKTIEYTGNQTVIINLVKDNKPYYSDTNNQKMADPNQFRNIYDYLRGKVSGVTISTNNAIRIRGLSTFSGGRAPLLVLNGVPVDETTFGDIVPTTIRSVKILKGPETAIYGMRGANGVIEVETAL